MTVEELANNLNLPQGELIDDTYLIVLKDSNDYARTYTKLSNSDILTLDDDYINLGTDNTSIAYFSNDYYIVLSANFVSDEYTVEITEVE